MKEDKSKRFIDMREAKTIADYVHLRTSYEKNGFNPQVIAITKELAEKMQSQIRSETITQGVTETGYQWEHENVTFVWDEWEEAQDLKIIDGKVYRRIP